VSLMSEVPLWPLPLGMLSRVGWPESSRPTTSQTSARPGPRLFVRISISHRLYALWPFRLACGT